MKKDQLIKSLLAGLFSAITIGALTYLTYKTTFGLFLIASFGSSMVLLYGFPESPFAQPKNIFFGHFLTSAVGIIVLNFVPLPIYITIPIGVGLGVSLMILLDVTHPPAGGNPIIVIIGSVSYDYLLSPIILGSIIVLVFGIVINNIKEKVPSKMDIKYNVSKIKGSKEEIVKDAVSVEEPLEMRLKYKKNGKIETQNISITMRTPGNDEDLIRGFLFNERIIENMDEIDSIQHIGDPVGDYNLHNVIEATINKTDNLDIGKLKRNFVTNSSCGVGKTSLDFSIKK